MASLLKVAQVVHFRLFHMPCCGTLICWINPRIPNRCPECGERVYARLKMNLECTLVDDQKASLKTEEGIPEGGTIEKTKSPKS